ncbi:hypothetical protein HYH03_006307 [Edaphochlamys debaryana]|uniref:Sulfatase N-terminal domain-containing protein n=1 Tax=Edaphochlamys debaryana TaxID=47281 RepID=A0A835Y3A2_9CHLO|nr:hypothetical protein HYH03_006307 [Edaphochlamys debaryana]|eukprot:KAG2495707.1 hypothetical protein HYH03_006307 [Edaphochlamys debaryana]
MLHKHFRLQGTEFPHFVTPIADCCPSRTVLLTGRHCHNTNLTSNIAPGGGYIGFKTKQLDKSYLPLWLQATGYRTMLAGKALNGFEYGAADKLGCLTGWDRLFGITRPPTKDDVEEMQRLSKQDPPQYLRWSYTDCKYVDKFQSTFPDDYTFEQAYAFAEDAVDAGQPFFLHISPASPHDDYDTADQYPIIPPWAKDVLPGLKVPKGPNYGKPCSPRLGMCGQRPLFWNVSLSDAQYRARMQAMLGIDAQLDRLITKLDCLGVLNNTYVIFTSDNGFKLGHHNIAQEKWTYFEEDVALPLFVRGPGIPKGVYAATVQASMVDLSATIASLAGASPTPGYQQDGAPLPFDLVASLNPNPNSPFGTYAGPFWSGKTLAAATPANNTCARPTRSPPRPPLPSPSPPSRRNGLAITTPDPSLLNTQSVETGDSLGATIGSIGSIESIGLIGSTPRNLAVIDHEVPAYHATEHVGFEARYDSLAAAARDLGEAGGAAAAWEWLQAAEAAGAGGSQGHSEEQGAEGAWRGEAKEAAEEGDEGQEEEGQPQSRTLLQTSPWSNVALIETFKTGDPWPGNDYRVVRACLPPSAAVAQSPQRGSSRRGNVCYKYVAYCAVRADPGKILVNQLFNLSSDPAEIDDLMLRNPRPAALQKLVNRLDAVLTVLSYCWGRTCTDPFSHIHGPDGGVHDLAAALDPKYDSLYAGYSKLGFKKCLEIYAGLGSELPDMRLVPQPQQSPPPPSPPSSTQSPPSSQPPPSPRRARRPRRPSRAPKPPTRPPRPPPRPPRRPTRPPRA